eukprot:jgi/Mesvir1/16748/Mv25199-RA.1
MANIADISADKVWLFAARHGERLDNVDPMYVQTSPRPQDPPLTERGKQQARLLGKRLQSEFSLGPSTVIYTSPFTRCVQTAAEVAAVLGVPTIKVEEGICELLEKSWFAWMPLEIQRRLWMTPQELHAKVSNKVDLSYTSFYRPPHTSTVKFESYRDCWRRCKAVGQHLVGRHRQQPMEKVLCVGHGASVEGLVLGLTRAPRVPPMNYTALTVLADRGADEPLSIQSLIDASHIQGL